MGDISSRKDKCPGFVAVRAFILSGQIFYHKINVLDVIFLLNPSRSPTNCKEFGS